MLARRYTNSGAGPVASATASATTAWCGELIAAVLC